MQYAAALRRFLLPMAYATAPPASCSVIKRHNRLKLVKHGAVITQTRRAGWTSHAGFRVVTASEARRKPPKAPPGVDTRIHWENEDDGWIGVNNNTSASSQSTQSQSGEDQKNFLGEEFADLLNSSSDSHYRFLGIAAGADMEEIKAAYRRLSKEYHPDTTSLPLKAASEKFMKLKQVYDVLSDEESRRFYDWTLAQEEASRRVEKMRVRLEDPYQQELDAYEPTIAVVDRLGGRNMKLSDQAATALTIDIFIIIFAICCIIYVIFFKAPYY